ncbi:hypothetical protein [Sulfuricurvum sp.]|uniref:hypothetical protein n=1 Tax=Sulfuricurvum sp. TaxID=2025608 RepID=UPI00286DF0D6|nr:hypothetical protein [Sulfuricurvum sp.]
MELLNKVMKYFTMFQSKNAPESQNFAGEVAQGAKVAAIAAALHHHDSENSDVRAKVAAIAAALHHHEVENSQNGGLLGIAALAAVIHHHNNLKK